MAGLCVLGGGGEETPWLSRSPLEHGDAIHSRPSSLLRTLVIEQGGPALQGGPPTPTPDEVGLPPLQVADAS